jgi:cytochrome c biogenesis protein CcmG/thiol:disulfide interchange protein DsbE
MWRFIIPLVVFLGLVGLFYVGLQKDPQELPSALLNKPAPQFALPVLHQPESSFASADMKGQVWILNVWASWCASCRSEHPLFLELARTGQAKLYGLNYKDERADALNWLNELGNPYVASLSDLAGNVGIDFGVYGVPETFVIDKQGVVRYKHVGPVSRQQWQEKFVPLLKELEG